MPNNNGKNKSIALDLQNYFYRLTVETFCFIGFGVKMNSLGEDTHFQTAFDRLQYVTAVSENFGPFFSLYQRLDKHFSADLDYLNRYVDNIIQTRKQVPVEDLRQSTDLLSRLLNGEHNGTIPNDTELRDWVMNFLIAGRDTTAALLTWVIYELNNHPEVMQKLVEEVDQVCPTDEEITWHQVGELRYMKRVLQETLRLRPSLPVEGVSAACDQTVNGVFIKANSAMIYCPWLLGRSKEIWGEDCLEFKPDRFIEPPKPYTLMAFHGGPRVCLGQEMAYVEAKVVLAGLLRRFTVEPDPSHKVIVKAGVIMNSANGLVCRLTKRVRE